MTVRIPVKIVLTKKGEFADLDFTVVDEADAPREKIDSASLSAIAQARGDQ